MSATPEERLETLRFFMEAHDEPSQSLMEWMQEVETQIARLRERINALPTEFQKIGPSW